MNLDVQSESSLSQASPIQRLDDTKHSSPVTYQQLEQTRAAFLNLTCSAARKLIPMGKNTRGPAPTAEHLQPALAGPNSDRILLISSTETPMNAFRKLIDYGVQSAPVIDPITYKCSGLLDLRDLVSLVALMEEEYQSARASELKLNTANAAIASSPSPNSSRATGHTYPVSPQRQNVPRAPQSPSRLRMQTKTIPTIATAPPAVLHSIPPLPTSMSASNESHALLHNHAPACSMPPTSSSSSMFIGNTANAASIPSSSSGPSPSASFSNVPIRPSASNKPLRSPSPASSNSLICAAPASIVPPLAVNVNSANPATYLGQVFNRMSVTRAVDHKPQDYTVTYLAARNRCVTVSSSESILSVISVLATTQDVHRVVVTENIDGKKVIVDIISQSDIVKIISALFGKHLSANPHTHECSDPLPASLLVSPNADAELHQSIETLHLGTAPVLSVPADASMFATLQLLSTHKVSGVAVVDHEGRFMGNTSGADLKLYLQAPSSAKLHMKVMDFLGEVRRSSSSTSVRTPTVCVSPNASLLYVVAKLTATGMHRVFVVDNVTQAPVAVISVEDIVKLLHKGFPSRRVDRSQQRYSKTHHSTTSSPTSSRAGSPSRKNSGQTRKLSLTASSAGPAVNVGTSYGSSLSPSPSISSLHSLNASLTLVRSNSNSMNMSESNIQSPQTPAPNTVFYTSNLSAPNSMSDADTSNTVFNAPVERLPSNSLHHGDGNNNSNSVNSI